MHVFVTCINGFGNNVKLHTMHSVTSYGVNCCSANYILSLYSIPPRGSSCTHNAIKLPYIRKMCVSVHQDLINVVVNDIFCSKLKILAVVLFKHTALHVFCLIAVEKLTRHGNVKPLTIFILLATGEANVLSFTYFANKTSAFMNTRLFSYSLRSNNFFISLKT